jgi:hypothetical protein
VCVVCVLCWRGIILFDRYCTEEGASLVYAKKAYLGCCMGRNLCVKSTVIPTQGGNSFVKLERASTKDTHMT